MTWTQGYAPLASPVLSALLAAVPLLILFVLLASGRFPGWVPALASTSAALILAVAIWRMPILPALSAGIYGAAFALFPILWIVIAALWMYNLSVESGQFAVIRATLSSVSSDRRLQALFIAFAFGSFLEGAAGFGTPVAITAAMLVGLGFDARYAAAICLLANSSPVAFAAAGVPVEVAAEVSGLGIMTISRIVGRQLPLLSLVVPLWLCVVLCGWRRSFEVLPAILVAGLSLALSQFLIANLSGPWMTGVLSGLFTMAALALFFRVWKPRRQWDFPGRAAAGKAMSGPPADPAPPRALPLLAVLRAWAPFLLMSALVLVWGTAWFKRALAPAGVSFSWPLLDGVVLRSAPIVKGTAPYRAVFGFAFLSAPGTAIFLAGVLSTILLPNLGIRKAVACLGRTLKSLRFTILTVCLVLATAHVMNYSGMSSALGLALAGTGILFPLFSPLLGWVGVLLTGSDTSSNALFCSLQRTTAEQLGLDPGLMVAANTSGGVAGKMVSPQSISVATASAGLAGDEGWLFRFTIGHSIAMALIVSALTLIQAYLLPGMIAHP
ncbi:MAG: lactate permease LctP family transporter [Spirochaetes bacterium]|nr:lactate permease LctP family transporter [Spirochaetota bacterium]